MWADGGSAGRPSGPRPVGQGDPARHTRETVGRNSDAYSDCPASPLHATIPPSHAPPSQPIVQFPVESHVWAPPSEHCVAPGEHTPRHVPLRHAELTQATALPQWHVASQVMTALPSHVDDPGVSQRCSHWTCWSFRRGLPVCSHIHPAGAGRNPRQRRSRRTRMSAQSWRKTPSAWARRCPWPRIRSRWESRSVDEQIHPYRGHSRSPSCTGSRDPPSLARPELPSVQSRVPGRDLAPPPPQYSPGGHCPPSTGPHASVSPPQPSLW